MGREALGFRADVPEVAVLSGNGAGTRAAVRPTPSIPATLCFLL